MALSQSLNLSELQPLQVLLDSELILPCPLVGVGKCRSQGQDGAS